MYDSGECRVLIPFDLIAQIMTHSTPSTISALMQTCHLYYHEGPKHLLRDGVVLLTHDQVAPTFVRFIYAEHGARFAYLRKLEIARLCSRNHLGKGFFPHI